MLKAPVLFRCKLIGNKPLRLAPLKNPKFHLRPVLECIQKHCFPLRDQMEWGYKLPYMLTGQLNRHPRAAIAQRASENRDDVVGFYDQLMEED